MDRKMTVRQLMIVAFAAGFVMGMKNKDAALSIAGPMAEKPAWVDRVLFHLDRTIFKHFGEGEK
jgi:hypothetical protein